MTFLFLFTHVLQKLQYLHDMNQKTFNLNILICLMYGSISILQTLNSRYLYRSLEFSYYSFIFAVQRIAIVILCYFAMMHKKQINRNIFIKIVPYSAVMCISNILSSYCITIMPIAAFLAFKKFIIFYILCISLIFGLPSKTNMIQKICIAGILLGGVLIGERDILNGNIIGYLCSLSFDLSEAISLQYSAYLFRQYQLEPQELLFYNAIVSLPYYIITILYEGETSLIIDYFKNSISLLFISVFLATILLALLSQLSSSYIAMKISPFQKSTVSNIKDLLLTLISVYYFKQVILTYISQTGIILCLVSSAIFANQELQHNTLQQIQPSQEYDSIQTEIQEIQEIQDEKVMVTN